MKTDLNCDAGELDDASYEAALLDLATSANIACGGHTGDTLTMGRTVRLALERSVRIGAHPSYPDRENFGRLEMALPAAAITQSVREQIESLDRIAQAAGAVVVHVKPHGALYNAAARDESVARAIGAAVVEWNPGAAMYGLAQSQCLEVWRSMGLQAVAEGFADRRYQADGSLRPRRFPDALITDPLEAAAQAVRLVRQGVAQTICVHSDTPGALAILKACRDSLP